jgi:hypothetical protein
MACVIMFRSRMIEEWAVCFRRVISGHHWPLKCYCHVCIGYAWVSA